MSPTVRAGALFIFVAVAIALSIIVGTQIRHTEWFIYTYDAQSGIHVHWFPIFFAIGVGGLAWTLLFDPRPRTFGLWLGYALLARVSFMLAVSLPGFIVLAFALIVTTPFLLAFQAIDVARQRPVGA